MDSFGEDFPFSIKNYPLFLPAAASTAGSPSAQRDKNFDFYNNFPMQGLPGFPYN
jgi:hypothetical protein